MKNTIFILAAMVLGAVACNEGREEIQIDKTDFSDIQRPIVGEGGLDPNYCEGCGVSYVEGDYCSEGGCETGDCNNDEYNAIANANNLTPLDNVTSYDIRDFLLNSAIGNDYISYYYGLGTLDQISLSNALDYYNFANEIITAVSILENGADTDVPVTTAFKNSAMVFVNNYRQLTSDNILLSNLDDIEADLIRFENKTKSEILNTIQ